MNNKNAGIYILDSFAILGFLREEPCAELIESLLHKAQQNHHKLFMNYINLGEVLYSCVRFGGYDYAAQVELEMFQLPIQYIQNDWNRIKKAAYIKAKSAIAYADCFAAATAIENKATIVTGDPEFKKLESEVSILWLPQRRK